MTHSLRLSIYLDFADFIDLYWKIIFCASDIISSLEFIQEMTTDFMQTVRLFNIDLHVVRNGCFMRSPLARRLAVQRLTILSLQGLTRAK